MTIYKMSIPAAFLQGHQPEQAIGTYINADYDYRKGTKGHIAWGSTPYIVDGAAPEAKTEIGNDGGGHVILFAKNRETLLRALTKYPGAVLEAKGASAIQGLLVGRYRNALYPWIRKSWMKTKATIWNSTGMTKMEARHGIEKEKTHDRGYFVIILLNGDFSQSPLEGYKPMARTDSISLGAMAEAM